MIIRKTFKADTAHRLLSAYTERCRGLHGHSYLFEIFIKGGNQDGAQMLMDFSLLSQKIKPFLDCFDHSLLVWDQDDDLVKLAPSLNERYIILPYNPTAEQIARHIFLQIQQLDVPINKVIVHETSTGCAEYNGDDNISIDLNKIIFSPKLQYDSTQSK